jgi:anti-sigma regulatory factor (Ser/Thr protein kinase)
MELTLPRVPTSAGAARREIASHFGDDLDSDSLASAQLLVSELVTNAVVYGQGTITLRAQLDTDRLLVEVIDEGKGFERQARRQPFNHLRGRGLAIVEAIASRWGIHEGTTHVWFELERPGPRLGTEKSPAS